MFGRKKETVQPSKSSSSRSNTSAKSRGYGQINLLDVPDLNDLENIGEGPDDDIDDDDELEAELLALQQGQDIRKVVSRKRLEDSLKPKAPQKNANNSMAGNNEDEDDDDDNVDENDPDLLAELQDIEENSVPVVAPSPPQRPAPPPPVPPHKKPNSVPQPYQITPNPRVLGSEMYNSSQLVLPPIVSQSDSTRMTNVPMRIPAVPSRPQAEIAQIVPKPVERSTGGGSPTTNLLQERLQLYTAALVNAKTEGGSAKIRRIERGIKSLESLLKAAKSGKSINEDDIPPPVAVGGRPAQTSEQFIDNGSEIPQMPEILMVQPSFPSSNSTPTRPENQSVTISPPRWQGQEPSAPPPPPRSRSITSANTGMSNVPTEKSPSLPNAYPVSSSERLPSGGKFLPNLQLENSFQDQSPVAASTKSASSNTLEMITLRRQQYRQAALAAKRENDKERTLQYVKISKQFDAVIAALESGQEVDLSGMPPPPPSHPNAGKILRTPDNQPIASTPAGSDLNRPMYDNNSIKEIEEAAIDDTNDSSIFNAPPPPVSVMEALQQRMEKYKSAQTEAQSSDNGSKARRMGRIVKQYEDAIKQHRAGKPVLFDELPVPPGFGPIPQTGQSNDAGPQPALAQSTHKSSIGAATVPQGPSPPARVAPSPPVSAKPVASLHPSVNASSTVPALPPQLLQPIQPVGALQPKPSVKSPTSLYEKQLFALNERQKLFKAAALDAKKRGDMQAAKEYLRVAKGFEPMINASKCGLPVNMDSLPTPPQSSQDNSFELVDHDDCLPIGERDEMFVKLEKELQTQIEMCQATQEHLSKIGDVQSAHKFEALFLDSKKDLDFVRYSKKRGDYVPRFHYETKTFSIVRCSTDLLDDDLELTIIKGINYTCPNPKEVDTYVKFELPFPPDTPQSNKTQTVHNTNNPEYNAVFKLAINRKSRVLTSVIKRKAIKIEVWSKGSFLRSDTLLGTAHVKLLPLETRYALHDSFDMMEGRKSVGGKVEVKVRLRDPIVTKQVETLCEKWLIVNGSRPRP